MADKLVKQLNQTHSEKQVKYLLKKLAQMGEKVTYCEYRKEWVRVW